MAVGVCMGLFFDSFELEYMIYNSIYLSLEENKLDKMK